MQGIHSFAMHPAPTSSNDERTRSARYASNLLRQLLILEPIVAVGYFEQRARALPEISLSWLRKRFYPDYAERAHHIILVLADGYIFSNSKFVIAQTVAAFVVIGVTIDVVMEGPLTAGFSHEMPEFVILVQPEPAHTAPLAILLPQDRIEMALRIQWTDKLVTVTSAALGMLTISRQFQSYFFQRHETISHAKGEAASYAPREVLTHMLRASTELPADKAY